MEKELLQPYFKSIFKWFKIIKNLVPKFFILLKMFLYKKQKRFKRFIDSGANSIITNKNVLIKFHLKISRPNK